MTFAEDLIAGLTELRAMAESRMRSSVEVRELTGRRQPDEETGRELVEYRVLHTLPCRIPPMTNAQEVTVGGATITTSKREIHIPTSSPEVDPSHVLVVVAVDDSSDPTVLGRPFRVLNPSPADQTTARRMQVQEETQPFEMVEEAP